MYTVSYAYVIIFACVLMAYLSTANGQCANGCSSRGICVAGVCQCIEGLTGVDCSKEDPLFASAPTLHDCPTCYSITVGPAVYYTGPSWRIPDGPIVAFNNKGSLIVYQGNGYYEIIGQGENAESFNPSTTIALSPGTDFDRCGVWLMRAWIDDYNNIQGFYHAETNCDYSNNGQTRKAGGYSTSTDGGYTFTKPNYPSNKILDTATSNLIGAPSGEGDFGMVMFGSYYYMLFSNVETGQIGVARSLRSDRGLPGTWSKYYNGQWSEAGVGGQNAPLSNVAGPQLYHHLPSRSLITVGSSSLYGSSGISLSVSTDAINWSYFADPVVSADPSNSQETILYQSLMGSAGGDSIGNTFDLYYLYTPPASTWSQRYQVRRQVTISRVDNSSTTPRTKLALTSYRNRVTGEVWETREMAEYPYKAISILGYLLTRPYPNSIQVYDCLNSTSSDHFVGVGNECFVATNVVVTRSLGYIFTVRDDATHAIYRCMNATDIFVSVDSKCGGYTNLKLLGFLMDGPSLSSDLLRRDILIPQGSTWKYTNLAPSTASWVNLGFDDSSWFSGSAPFATGYSVPSTAFGTTDFYFRKTFQLAYATSLVDEILLSVASDNYAIVYVNGVLVDSDTVTWHEAAYWNRQIYLNTSLLNGVDFFNEVSVVVRNGDQWSFFDLQIQVKYAAMLFEKSGVVTCKNVCGSHGQCTNGTCACDNGWSGDTCNVSSCYITGSQTTAIIIPRGSVWLNTQWQYVPSTPVSWIYPSYDDTWMHTDVAPFGTSNYGSVVTYIPAVRHLYRKTVNVTGVAAGKIISSVTLMIAADDFALVWINGVLADGTRDPYTPTTASYWNRVVSVNPSLIVIGPNTIAVEIPIMSTTRTTAYFDLQLQVTYDVLNCPSSTTSSTSTSSASTTSASTTSASTTSASTTSASTTSASTTSASTTSASTTSTSTTSASTTSASTTSTSSTTSASTSSTTSASTSSTTSASTSSTTGGSANAKCKASASLSPRSSSGWTQGGVSYNLYDFIVTNTGSCAVTGISVNMYTNAALSTTWNFALSSGVISGFQTISPSTIYSGAGFIMGGNILPNLSIKSVTCVSSC